VVPDKPHAHHLRVQRTARYYTLGGGIAPRTVWIVLHGYSQLAGDFIRYFKDLSSDDTLVVAPEALNRYYTVPADSAPARDRPVGATWMTREDRASEIADYVEYLETLYEEVAAGPARDGARVNLIGFSQGASTATRWITHGKAHVDRLVLWGGLTPPETDFSRGHSGLRHTPITIVVGARDQYVTDDMLAAEQARFETAQVPFNVIRFDGGHVVSRAVFPELATLA
jgi:predicted esterase